MFSYVDKNPSGNINSLLLSFFPPIVKREIDDFIIGPSEQWKIRFKDVINENE